MKRTVGCLASVLAMSVACAASSDDEMAFGPSPVTVGNASSTPSGDDGETDDVEDTGGDDDGSAPEATGGVDDGAPPPPTDDGAPPPPSDDGGNPPPPPPTDDGGVPPVDATPNCQSYCQTIDMCGWLAETGETVEECGAFCSEPLDMGPCDAAWDVLAGCLGGLDCATLEQLDAGMGTACQAEIQAEEAACSGA